MKSSSLLPLVSTSLLLAACGSVRPVPADAPAIVLSQEEARECGQGRVVFPVGIYQPEAASEKGIYYAAPSPLRTSGVLISRSKRGGIFVSNGQNTQAAWFGELRSDTDESPGTLLGAIGWSAPKLWPYTPRLPLRQR